jgi:tRNA(fMet)-specific endonuclease VapC
MTDLLRFMLDTDIISYRIRRKDASVLARFVAQDPATLCLSAVTRGEIRAGLAQNPAAVRVASEVRLLFNLIDTMPWDEAAADVYGKIAGQLFTEGTPIGQSDTMIAAHALSLGLILVTNNTRHYSRIPGLKLENWAA